MWWRLGGLVWKLERASSRLGVGGDPSVGYDDLAGLGARLAVARVLGGQVDDHGLLVAVEVLLAAQAVTPDLHGEALAGHLAKAAFAEEIGRRGEGKDGLEL